MARQFQEDQKVERFYVIDSYPLNGICLYYENYNHSHSPEDSSKSPGPLPRGSQPVCALQVRTPRIDRFSRIHLRNANGVFE
jgi:hypothetical protein